MRLTIEIKAEKRGHLIEALRELNAALNAGKNVEHFTKGNVFASMVVKDYDADEILGGFEGVFEELFNKEA